MIKSIFRAMEKNFYVNKEIRDKDKISDYYYKWTSTLRISKTVGVPVDLTRRTLYQLLTEGKVERKRASGVLLWAPAQEISTKTHR